MIDAKISEKNASQFAEEIDAMGQPSEEKAVKWVKEVEDREEKKRQEKEDSDNEKITKKRRFKKNDYYHALFLKAQHLLAEYEVPRNYQVEVIETEDGRLIFGLRKIGFRWYAKGMKICGEPKYDLNCIQRLVVQTFIALDELEQQHEQQRTKSGIILPHRLS